MKRHFIALFCFFCLSSLVAQNQNAASLRQQMAKIRQTTNWDDPAAAMKANKDIQKLASQLNGGTSQVNLTIPNQTTKTKSDNYVFKTAANKENIVAIANRFYQRSYKRLDAIAKTNFNLVYKTAEREKFSLKAIRKLSSTGAALITIGNDPDLACVYLTTAVKVLPDDTLSINNFGGYLRIIDSTEISIPVLLYANILFSGSPVILAQLGNSYFELGDFAKAESYYKKALKYNPDFGDAHKALCELYIKQNRLQDAVDELFAGVKNRGSSYKQASNNFKQIQQQYENSSGKNGLGSKEDFWDEAKKQMDPSEALASLVPEDNRVIMPVFPDCSKVEDWVEGGGFANAVNGYKSFHADLTSFSNKNLEIREEVPNLPPNALLRDYPTERFMIDCINEYFSHESRKAAEKYRQSMDEISQQVYDAKELYLNNYELYSATLVNCMKDCAGEPSHCLEECERVFCSNDCPNTSKYNEKLRQGYNGYRVEFSALLKKQKELLNDLYGFTNPLLSQIYSPYWSKVYAYEIKSVALSMVAECYASYPQPFIGPVHTRCGPDCSVFGNPFFVTPDKVIIEDPKGNKCSKGSKVSVSLLICEAALDCESIEFGCTAGLSISAKRNFGKSTTIFVGTGVEVNLGLIKAGAKTGGTITFGDDNSVDVGLKSSFKGVAPTGIKDGVKGIEVEVSLTLSGGLQTETTKIRGPGSILPRR